MAILGGNERDLTVRLLANVDNFKKNINDAQKQTDTFGSKTGDAMKKVGAAFAAAAAAAVVYAGKLIIDGVKAAIEDEAAQIRLATALKNVTGATDQQIAAIERQILTLSLATGTADDKLRPAFQRLAIATGDTTKAQDLLKLSLDISAATGKDLESVTNAVGRAYEGSTTALGRLGIGISTTDIKALGLEGTMAKLNEKFGGAAQAQADTFQGKIARLKVAFDEAKETVGAALLPVLSQLFEFITSRLVPIFQTLVDDFNQNVRPAVEQLWAFIKENFIPVLVAWWRFLWEELIPVLRDLFAPVVLGIIEILRNLETRVDKSREAFDKLGAMLDKVWFFIKTYLVPLIEFVLINKLKELEVAVNTVVTVTEFLINNIERLIKAVPGLELLLKALGFAWEKSGAAAQYQQEKNDAARKSWLESTIAINTEFKPAVKETGTLFESLTTSTTSATNATKQLTAATRESTKALQEQFSAAQSLDLLRAGFGSAIGGVVQPGSANIKPQLPGGETFRSAAELIGQFGGKIVGFNANPNDPFYGFTKGDTLDLFKKSSGTNVVVNVNGTVMDPEGVARAVSDVLVRSGGRAGNLPLGDLLGVA